MPPCLNRPELLQALIKGVRTTSTQETESLAQRFSRFIPPDAVLALYGAMGTGKTTFVQGLARGWKIDTPVTSPTFSIVSIYNGDRNLIHLDAFRIDDPSQYDELLLEDIIRSPYCLAIEWPEHLGDRLPDSACRIDLSRNQDQSCLIAVDSFDCFLDLPPLDKSSLFPPDAYP